MKGIKTGKAIGALIKHRRRSIGLSQEKLAVALGVSYQQIQRYENGTNLLSTDKLQIIAQVLEMPVGYFFDEEVGDTEGAGKATVGNKSKDESKMLRLYRNADAKYKRHVNFFLKLAIAKRKH